jgi:hypothetical protein
MINIGARLAVLSLITGLAVLTSAQAQERKIKREDLPPAVEKTVAAQSQGAAIKGFSSEVEGGKTLYEVELTINGHGKDISMDKDGKIVEVEEEVKWIHCLRKSKRGLQKQQGAARLPKWSPSRKAASSSLMKQT